MQRFTLDEDKAREWLASAVNGDADVAEGPWLAEDWQPVDEYDGSTISNLLDGAQAQGIITVPEGVEEIMYDYANDEDGGGYRWMVYVKADSARHGLGSLRLSSVYCEAKQYAYLETRGAGAALDVLREAVSEANGVLDDLVAYVLSTSPCPA